VPNPNITIRNFFIAYPPPRIFFFIGAGTETLARTLTLAPLLLHRPRATCWRRVRERNVQGAAERVREVLL
jgi:cytochrome P450